MNSSWWSSRASGHPEVVTRNLTFGVPSNQIAAKLLVVAASNVPIAVSGDCRDRSFNAMARVAKADLQITSPFPSTWLSPTKPGAIQS